MVDSLAMYQINSIHRTRVTHIINVQPYRCITGNTPTPSPHVGSFHSDRDYVVLESPLYHEHLLLESPSKKTDESPLYYEHLLLESPFNIRIV